MRFFFVISLLLFMSNAECQLTAEQQSVKKVFFDFLKYYEKNEKTFNSFSLYKGTGTEKGPPYRIQWKEAERYFAFLRTKVPYVGEAYIKNERADFKYYDSCFKADVEEEIPAGFDFDRWAGGQESVEYMVMWHTDPRNTYIVTINGNKAILRIGSPLMEGVADENRVWNFVPFVKEKGRWKMAGNITPEDYERYPEEVQQ